MLTLLSGHSLSKKTRHLRVVRMLSSFIIGVFVLTFLLLSALAYYFTLSISHSNSSEQLITSIACGMLLGLGLATWIFYYRKGPGTVLWIPRSFAVFLNNRIKATKNSVEAFSLGMTSVIAELLFTASSLTTAAIAIVTLPNPTWQLIGILAYALTSLLALIIVFFMVSGGRPISQIQAWRERNKRFLQFAAGGSMLILSAFIFVDRILGVSYFGGF